MGLAFLAWNARKLLTSPKQPIQLRFKATSHPRDRGPNAFAGTLPVETQRGVLKRVHKRRHTLNSIRIRYVGGYKFVSMVSGGQWTMPCFWTKTNGDIPYSLPRRGLNIQDVFCCRVSSKSPFGTSEVAIVSMDIANSQLLICGDPLAPV